MKKITLQLIFILSFPTFLCAQNLVINPSFEETGHCVTEDDINKYQNIPYLYLSQCRSWASFSTEGTADLYQPCNGWTMRSMTQKAKPHNGLNFAGIYAFDQDCCEEGYREYLVGKLKVPLEKGENYKVSFFVLLSDKSNYATSSLGVYFSQDTLYRTDGSYAVAPFIPQIQNQKGKYLTDKQGWNELTFDYKAKGGERFLMIGDFLPKSDTIALPNGIGRKNMLAYYYIDDVCVSAKNCNSTVVLPHYGFDLMVSEVRTNAPVINASAEMTGLESTADHVVVKTRDDGRAKFKLSESEYLLFLKADCYMPSMTFFNVPVIKGGQRQQDQMQYLVMTKQEKGAKIIFQEIFSYSIPQLQSKKSERLPYFFMRLDKFAEYLKENPSLKISLNAGLNFRYTSETKKAEEKEIQNTNLLFMQNYFFDKGVKRDQVSIKIIELGSEQKSVSGYADHSYIGSTTDRYEIEILELSCKDKPKEEPVVNGSFFHKNEIGSVYILDKVFFSPDSPELKKNSYEELDRLLNFLKQNENLKVRINGHTDIGKANGSDEFLQKLSENRAKAVADYLISKGAKADNITWQGFANRKPIADNNTEEGKAQNRRVEVEILEF